MLSLPFGRDTLILSGSETLFIVSIISSHIVETYLEDMKSEKGIFVMSGNVTQMLCLHKNKALLLLTC